MKDYKMVLVSTPIFYNKKVGEDKKNS